MRDADTFIEEINSIDEQCAPDSGVSLLDLRTRWDALRNEIRSAQSSEIDNELKLILSNRLAETGIELLGRMLHDTLLR